jgi:hypothetical protein
MTLIRLMRNADGSSAGGGQLPPSLSDLDNPTPPNLGENPPAGDPPPEPIEGVDADGNLLEGYERLEDGTVQKVEPPAGDDDDDDDLNEVDPAEFWKSVDTLTGKPVAVEYGDVDPLSPEGVAMRESAVREVAVEEFDEYMRVTYPRAYAYFLHTQNGGSDEEFFDTPAQGMVDRAKFESDPDIQAHWITTDLVNRGVPAEVAKATVDSYIKSNSLKEKALEVYQATDASNRARLAEMEETNKKAQQVYTQSVQALNESITKTIKSDMKLVVPEAKQREFQQFVLDRVQHDGKKFFFVQEVGQDLNTALDALYLQYVKGDLKSLVEKRAQTKAVHRLGQRIKADATQTRGSASSSGSKGYIPLSQI